MSSPPTHDDPSTCRRSESSDPGLTLVLQAVSLERLFADLAVAFSDLIVEDVEVVARESRSIELGAETGESLLWDWVEQLESILHEEDMLFARSEVSLHEGPQGPIELRARLWGEPYDPQWHPRRREPGPWNRVRSTLERPEGTRGWRARLVFGDD